MFRLVSLLAISGSLYQLAESGCGQSDLQGSLGGLHYAGKKDRCTWTFNPPQLNNSNYLFTIIIFFAEHYKNSGDVITLPDGIILPRKNRKKQKNRMCLKYVSSKIQTSTCSPYLEKTPCMKPPISLTKWPPQLNMSLSGYITFALSYAFYQCIESNNTMKTTKGIDSSDEQDQKSNCDQEKKSWIIGASLLVVLLGISLLFITILTIQIIKRNNGASKYPKARQAIQMRGIGQEVSEENYPTYESAIFRHSPSEEGTYEEAAVNVVYQELAPRQKTDRKSSSLVLESTSTNILVDNILYKK